MTRFQRVSYVDALDDEASEDIEHIVPEAPRDEYPLSPKRASAGRCFSYSQVDSHRKTQRYNHIQPRRRNLSAESSFHTWLFSLLCLLAGVFLCFGLALLALRAFLSQRAVAVGGEAREPEIVLASPAGQQEMVRLPAEPIDVHLMNAHSQLPLLYQSLSSPPPPAPLGLLTEQPRGTPRAVWPSPPLPPPLLAQSPASPWSSPPLPPPLLAQLPASPRSSMAGTLNAAARSGAILESVCLSELSATTVEGMSHTPQLWVYEGQGEASQPPPPTSSNMTRAPSTATHAAACRKPCDSAKDSRCPEQPCTKMDGHDLRFNAAAR